MCQTKLFFFFFQRGHCWIKMKNIKPFVQPCSNVWNAVINQSASRQPECWRGKLGYPFRLSPCKAQKCVTFFCIVNRGIWSISLCGVTIVCGPCIPVFICDRRILPHNGNNYVSFCGRLVHVDGWLWLTDLNKYQYMTDGSAAMEKSNKTQPNEASIMWCSLWGDTGHGERD